jgi:hypothetical protein
MDMINFYYFVAGAVGCGIFSITFLKLYEYFKKVITSDDILSLKSAIGYYELSGKIDKRYFALENVIEELEEKLNKRIEKLEENV